MRDHHNNGKADKRSPRRSLCVRRLGWVIAAAWLILFSPRAGFAAGSVDDGDDGRAQQPNILFILADDLGREGVGAYGSNLFDTPNIDRLAREGMTFTMAFSNPYCTPTRSELLTGRYPFATGTGQVIFDYERHKELVLDTSQPSFARQLKKAGYSTAIAGKWQLSFLSKQDWVHDFGFDTYMLWQIMTDQNERTTRYYNPHYRKDGRVIADEIKHRYGPDVLVDFLIDFMESSRESGRPFMAYYTAMLPHYPWVPTPGSREQQVQDQSDRIQGVGIPKFFPDMVMRLDHNVGRLLDALEEMGVSDNTVVIFLTDNGTDQRLFGRVNGRILYGGKGTMTDRSTHVPLLVRWPGKVRPGSFDEDLVEAADFLPTLCEIASAPLPDQPIHGKSFAPRLLEEPRDVNPKPWVHIQMADDRYLRARDWIVTDEGVTKRVQPYPFDAIEVDPQRLKAADREMLSRLKAALDELPMQQPAAEHAPGN